MSISNEMAALRREVTAHEEQAVKNKQQVLAEKHAQLQKIAEVKSNHQEALWSAENVKRLHVQHMNIEKSDAADQLLHTETTAKADRELAQRRLETAERRAAEAHSQAEKWKARSAEQTAMANHSAQLADEHVQEVQQISKARIEEAHANAHKRVEHGKALVEETVQECDRRKAQCALQRDSLERTHDYLQQQNCNRAEVVRHHAALRVQSAVEKSTKAQQAAVKDIERSREAVNQTQMEAKRSIEEMRRQCELAIEAETRCSEQALRMANELCKATEDYCEVQINRKKEELGKTENQHVTKLSNFDEEKAKAVSRNAQWLDKNTKAVESAIDRCTAEKGYAEDKVKAAEAILQKMQTRCDLYVEDVKRQWEEAKGVDAERVRLAQVRADDLTKYAEKTFKECQERCAALLVESQKHADKKKAHSEDRVKAITDLADQRIAMNEKQSQGRRALAEKQLAQMEKYLEDLKEQTTNRKKNETETADQKITLAKERFAAEIAKAERRMQDAQASRDKAKSENDTVMARINGAAFELYRRNLPSVAKMFEGEPVPPKPPTPEAPAPVADQAAPEPVPAPPAATESTAPVDATEAPADGLVEPAAPVEAVAPAEQPEPAAAAPPAAEENEDPGPLLETGSPQQKAPLNETGSTAVPED